MFNSNIITYEMCDELEFSDVYTFINKNDDEHYGFYKFLYVGYSSRQNVFLHITRNGTESILVNAHDRVKDYFRYTDETKRNNIMLIERPYVHFGFDKINIDDNDLIPVNPDDVCLYDQRAVVFRNKITNALWLVHRADSYNHSLGYLFFLSRVKEGKTQWVRYTKAQFNSDFNTTLYTPYLLKNDVDVRFTIKLHR